MKPAKKTDAELKGAESRFEFASQLSGALVFIGLLIEVWGAVEYRPAGVSLTQTWEPAVSGVLVAVGVFFEIMFGRWSLQQGAELRQRAEHALAEATDRASRAAERAAEASERSAKLEKEAADARGRVADIERLTSWRHISDEQRIQIAVSLEHMAGDIDLLIEYQIGDAEAFTYAREIAGIFISSGVTKIRGNGNSYLGTGFFGVFMSATFPPINLSFVTNSFLKADVKVWQLPRDLSTHLPSNVIAPNLYIFVAPKPPPAFSAAALEPLEETPVIMPANMAEALHRAAEVDARTARRRLSAEQARAIAEAMRGGTTVSMTHAENDPEAFSFGSDIKRALETAGAKVTLGPASLNGEVVSGLWVTPREGDSGEAERLMKALGAAGLAFAKSSEPANRLRLHVGHKPSLSGHKPLSANELAPGR